MSRSYKAPYFKQRQDKRDKRQANKTVRQTPLNDDIADGKSFRKKSNSWDICDYSFYAPKNPKARRK